MFLSHNLQEYLLSKQKKIASKHVIFNHKNIYVLPTKNGLVFLFLIGLLLLISFVYNNNLVYFLSFLIAGIFLVSLWYSFNALFSIKLTVNKCHSAFVGEEFVCEFVFENPGKEDKSGLEVGFVAGEIKKINLKKFSSLKQILHANAAKRGWHEIKTVKVSSTHPFGLFRAWTLCNFNEKVLAYPEPSKKQYPLPSDGTGKEAGEQLMHGANGDDFNGLKEYQKGDSMKRMHWKAFAKGQGLMTKQFSVDSGAVSLWLDYSLTPGVDMENRLSQLSRWLIEAQSSGEEYGLVMPGVKIEPAKGDQHFHECLKQLALFNLPDS